MDYRDRPIWMDEARREYARKQLRAIEAASVAWMSEKDQRATLAQWHKQLEEEESQEQIWAKNRQELKEFFRRRKGRKK